MKNFGSRIVDHCTLKHCWIYQALAEVCALWRLLLLLLSLEKVSYIDIELLIISPSGHFKVVVQYSQFSPRCLVIS